MTETFIKTLIYIHGFFGGIGLLAGYATIIVKKGSTRHKLYGKVFSIGMLVSSLLSLIIAKCHIIKTYFYSSLGFLPFT